MPDADDQPDDQPSRLLLAVEATPEALLPRLRDAWDGGPAVLPLDPRLPPRARGALVAALKPGAVSKPGGLVSLPGATPVADDVVAVVATSGSTGPPKGVELTRHALAASVDGGLSRTGADPEVPWVACLPVSHVGGLLVLLRAITTGTAPVDVDGFDADRIAALGHPVHLAVVPTMLRRLLAAGADPERWATVLVGGARLPDDLRSAVPHLTTTYGMTETSGGCVYDGVPLPGVTVSEADDGRLRIGGATLMRGYRRLAGPSPTPPPPAGLDPDGAFTPADLGTVDDDGRVTVLGRADDVIVTGGEKVVASQVAARLEAHPAVAEAEVLGVPDPEWGQRAVAVVVPAEVGAILSLALLRSFVADEMPRYAAPQDLVVVNALPRLATGKVDRVALRRALSGR
ncbi:AMP-binding protein [Euzebya sp.]|uniref:AMP-binding protein n=1 Tax=Euzebya sp. TaxID=1971409 RepID=UPI0035160959